MPSTDILKKALSLLTGTPAAPDNPYSPKLFRLPKNRPFKKFTERELITLESKIGATIFGPVPRGHRREFFCLDDATWIWHESWKEKGVYHETTIRYEIHDNGVLKVLSGARYEFISGEELTRFITAVQLYYERVTRDVYGRDPKTGQKIAPSSK